jgi:hypothetical protein
MIIKETKEKPCLEMCEVKSLENEHHHSHFSIVVIL